MLKTVKVTEIKEVECCDRCEKPVAFFSFNGEWTVINGSKIAVRGVYCEKCKEIISNSYKKRNRKTKVKKDAN